MFDTVRDNFLVPLGHMFYIVDPNLLVPDGSRSSPAFIEKAIPFFFLLIFIEAIYSIARKAPAYNIEEAVCSISLGIVQQSFGLLIRYFALVPYSYVYNNWRFFDVPTTSLWSFFALIFLMDLGYYWMHRMAHEFHIMWMGHSVHHSGEYYNLATALRQGATQTIFSRFFYIPMAFLGFHPFAMMGHDQLNTLYQFWIHTDQVGKLGAFEIIFNTPSHHRLHHRPPGNCNYAGVLIIWDRMFGTFREELKKRDFYGLGNQLNTFNPIYPNYQHVIRMLNIDLDDRKMYPVEKTKYPVLSFMARVIQVLTRRRVHHPWTFKPTALLVGSPTALPDEVGPAPSGRVKYGSYVHLPVMVKVYSRVHFVLALVHSVFLLKTGGTVPYRALFVHVLVLCLSLLSVNMLNEAHPMAYIVESFRIGLGVITSLLMAVSSDAKATLLPYVPLRLDLSQNLYFWCAQLLSVAWAATYALSSRHFRRSADVKCVSKHC